MRGDYSSCVTAAVSNDDDPLSEHRYPEVAATPYEYDTFSSELCYFIVLYPAEELYPTLNSHYSARSPRHEQVSAVAV